MRWLLLGLLLAPLAWAEAPERIISINLCADALALSLVPERVVAVSHLARDPRLSPVVAEAQQVPVIDGDAETVLRLAPDLVLAGRFTTRQTVRLLQHLGVTVLELDTPTTVAGSRAQLLEVATALGVPGRGRALLAKLDQALHQSADPGGPAPLTAVYLPNGATAGQGSLIAELLSHTGLENLADRLGIQRWGTLSLESLLLTRPAVLIIEQEREHASLATALLNHPALASLPARQVAVPGRYWTCPGPWLAGALERLAAVRGGE